MNRRSFLQSGTATVVRDSRNSRARSDNATSVSWNKDRKSRSLAGAGDLSPYQPRPDKPWNQQRAAHLLRRIGFGPTWSEINTALQATPGTIVSALMTVSALPASPGSWTDSAPFAQVGDTERAKYYTWVRDMQEWWVNLMLTPASMLREKMTLFWHNHFVSEYTKVEVTQYMFKQNQLFREFAFGDFRELTKRVTVDPAMLIYLDGATSRQGNPNENYGRELMELFTLGAGAYNNGTPHYSEHDIIELARALTGWTVNGLNSEFKSARFDSGNKTIFGTTQNFGVVQQTANVIDHIFTQTDIDLNQKRAAVFICSKLYQYFVYEVPDMTIVAGMAQTLEQNNWQIGPVLQQLLTSEHFFDDNVMGAKIKSPVDFVLSSIRQFNLTAVTNRSYDPAKPETHDPNWAMYSLSQWLFYPPNVKGWIGGRTWISSATVPLRIRYSKMWVEPVPGALAYNFQPVTFIKSLPDATDVDKVVDHLINLLLPVSIPDDVRRTLFLELTGGSDAAYEWNPDASNADSRIRACLIRIANLGEYQLM